MSEKYRCIKDYYCYGNLAFRECEIYDGVQAILLTRLYTKVEYIKKYTYPISTHFVNGDPEFDLHFINYQKRGIIR